MGIERCNTRNKMDIANLRFKVVILHLFINFLASRAESIPAGRWDMRLMDYMIRNDNDEEGFKKERGVRGQCLYTYLELESKSTKSAIDAVHDLAGWEELSQADSRYAALDKAYNKYNDEVKQKVDPMEEAKGLTKLHPSRTRSSTSKSISET